MQAPGNLDRLGVLIFFFFWGGGHIFYTKCISCSYLLSQRNLKTTDLTIIVTTLIEICDESPFSVFVFIEEHLHRDSLSLCHIHICLNKIFKKKKKKLSLGLVRLNQYNNFGGYLTYCKSGNIRGTLIFAYFAQIQQARIQKPAKIFAVPKWQVSICSARI